MRIEEMLRVGSCPIRGVCAAQRTKSLERVYD